MLKYFIYDVMGSGRCRPGFETLKKAVDMAKDVCALRFKDFGEEYILHVDRMIVKSDGRYKDWDFETVRVVRVDDNGKIEVHKI